MYDPVLVENPYLMLLIGGSVFRVPLDGSGPVQKFTNALLQMPPTEPQAFMTQGEEFLIIQAGDYVTLPLFWDGVTLRRSKGITTSTPPVGYGSNGVNELPAAGPMTYYMERIWYGQGRTYSAGDIVGGDSGSLPYGFRDSILNVTENPLVLGGDGFGLPSNAGNVRMLLGEPNLDAQLGTGRLLVGTRKAIFALTVPVTRNDWIGASTMNQPLQVIAQKDNGPVNDRSVVTVNADLFYQSLEPSIRTYLAARKDFSTRWGNTPISSNENRILQFNDRSLLRFSSGIYFQNRLLQTALPAQTPQGVIHPASLPLDFEPISSFGREGIPAWEGHYEGLDVLQYFTGDFGGLERAFAVVRSRVDQSIEVWELTSGDRFENGDGRVTWYSEFGAFNWNRDFQLKKLVSAELWIDKLFGEVDFTMEYRPDGDVCYHPWHKWKLCAARTSCEDVNNPVCGYPAQGFRESFKSTITLPVPPTACETISARPLNVAYQIQPRLTIHGWCRVRGLLLHAELVERQLYAAMVC